MIKFKTSLSTLMTKQHALDVSKKVTSTVLCNVIRAHVVEFLLFSLENIRNIFV